jgi:hypothetical protein
MEKSGDGIYQVYHILGFIVKVNASGSPKDVV